MTLERPEGLAPCYLSLASPDIAESHAFIWIFRGVDSKDYQTKFTITVYTSTGDILKTFTESSGRREVDMSEIGFNFQIGTTYLWTVKTYGRDNVPSELSIFAKFKYDSCPAAAPITWSYIPEPGEVITKGTYFVEMKNNILSVLSEYNDVSSTLITNVNSLFSGEIIPTRKDFKTLELVVDYLSTTLENHASIDVDGPIENSFGVSDLEKIRRHIDLLLTIAPKPVQEISIEIPSTNMYDVLNIHAASDGKEDSTIDVTWGVEALPSQKGKFIFNNLSPSKDVLYYECIFEYGPSSRTFMSRLFFKADELSNGSYRTFDMDWAGLYTASNINTARQVLRVTAVDHRNNFSTTISKTKTYDDNFKAPIGLSHYEVAYYKTSLGSSTYEIGGAWNTLENSTDARASHSLVGAEGKFFYRVRAVDISGLKSAWIYSNGILFDPLKPPGTPTNLHSVGTTQTTIHLDWNTVPTAENYEVHRYRNNGVGSVEGVNLGVASSSDRQDSGLASSTNYNYFVRAINRAGISDWAGTTLRTSPTIYDGYWDSNHCHTYVSGYGWKSQQGVGHTYAYQGEWQGGGKHRAMWYFDHRDIWNRTSGGQILEVWVSIERMRAGYASADTPAFWTHNHDSDFGGFPDLWGPGHHDWNVSFTPGERKWVRLPNYIGERLRDQSARGIAIYEDDGSPYLKFGTWAQLHIKWQK